MASIFQCRQRPNAISTASTAASSPLVAREHEKDEILKIISPVLILEGWWVVNQLINTPWPRDVESSPRNIETYFRSSIEKSLIYGTK